MNENVDAIIIGAGVVGCSIALALSKRGLRTLNIDKLPSAGYGSTSHSSAIIRPIYSHVSSAALAHEARHYWQAWQTFIGPDSPNGYANYTECGGLLFVPEGQDAAFEANLTAMREVGVTCRTLTPKQIEDKYPGICLDQFGPPKRLSDSSFGEKATGKIGAAIEVDEVGYVSDPQLATQNLQFAATQLGARFRFNFSVTEIQEGLVRLDNGDELTSSIVINAAGPHSGQINQLAGVDVGRTRPMRHEVAYVNRANTHFSQFHHVMFDLDCGIYQRPDGADCVIGSADPECDPEEIVDPDNYNRNLTEQWTTQTHRAAQRFPDLGIPNTARGTVGVYDVSDDWIPIYDKTDRTGYYVAIGTSGNQFKNSPLIGEVMAQIIGQGAEHDTTPATLHLKHLNRQLDLSFFSRNRPKQNLSGVLA